MVTVTDEAQLYLPELQSLLDQFSDLFKVPMALPPRRVCDHAIPLVEGAAPVQIRRYHYPPALKTEIEKQISKMLENGSI
jgi:hypothetical protein